MDLTKEMAAEVEDLIGPGYVPDYYRSLAAGFVGVAENYAESALAARLAAVEAIVTDWGAGTVHRPRSPHYHRLRAALATTNQEEAPHE